MDTTPASHLRPRTPELLAPAGDPASMAAALLAGADAVYFGLDEGLNARARATNFPLAALDETVEMIHRAGARAYLTLNTLVFEDELRQVEGFIRRAAAAGVDALIVQDPAVALLAARIAPTLQVHASTQMTISSPEAAKFAEQLGVTRVVVPRELSVDEIRAFAAGTSLELEVFVHGALCVSWSGQCLSSEAWGGRSANRGQCAQACRMPYDLMVDGEVRPLGEVRYLLSPLDQSAAQALPELVAIGVATLKIEGRQKGPQYVQTAVQGYRRWLGAIAEGRAEASQALARQRADLTDMAVSFSRGMSGGFLAGADHQSLVEGRFPKHRGVLLGLVAEVRDDSVRVVRAGRVHTGGVGLHAEAPQDGPGPRALPPLADLEPAPGMGVGFDIGRPEEEEPGGHLFGVEPTGDGWWLRLGRLDRRGGGLGSVLRAGHRVWLTSDPRLTRDTAKLLDSGEAEGRVPVSVICAGRAGAPLVLRWSTRARGVAVEGPVQASTTPLQAASGGGLTEAMLRDKLGALGGTPLRLEGLDVSGLNQGLHLPVSELKRLRREAVAPLLEALATAHRHQVAPAPASDALLREAGSWAVRRPALAPQRPVLLPLCRTEAQLEAVIAAGLPRVELDWMELVGLTRAVDRARNAGLEVTVATVRVQKPGEDGYDRRIARLRPDGVLTRHWGALMHFAGLPDAERPQVHGDFSLNVANSATAHHLLHLGADTLTAAHDLDERQLLDLLEHFPAERLTVVAHHHIATFHTEHCVYAHTLSHGRDFRSCGRPCESHRLALRDHLGQAHPVVVDVGCRNTVFNAAAQSAPSVMLRLAARGVRRFRLEFVSETGAQCGEVLRAWRGLFEGELTPEGLLERVGAHEQFGLTRGTLRPARSLEAAPPHG